MKTLIKFALAAVMLITTLTAQAGWVSGYYRSNGTYVAPYYRSDYGSVGGS
jgi:Flp pilus assembly pilin Flp